ncbi:MAG: ATP-dependent metallopeptidase FtsH/Yme1/Tma family protein [Terriglobales bacterium]
MNRTIKAVIFWAVILVSAVLLWQTVRSGSNPSAGQVPEISYTAFLAQVSEGHVRSVTIAGNVVRALDDKGANFRVVVPSNQTAMMDALQQHGVEIWFRETAEGNWPAWVLNLAPLILLGALWFFMIRQMRMRGKIQQDMPGAAPPQSQSPRFGP